MSVNPEPGKSRFRIFFGLVLRLADFLRILLRKPTNETVSYCAQERQWIIVSKLWRMLLYIRANSVALGCNSAAEIRGSRNKSLSIRKKGFDMETLSWI